MLHVIIGAPCSGKSTYVEEHAQAGDIRIDFDRIATAIGSEAKHGSEGHLRKCAFEMRDAAIAYLLANFDAEGWVIHSNPTESQLASYTQAGAEFVTMDTDMETCLARASEDGRPDGTEEVIRSWFERNQKGATMPNYKSSGNATMEDAGIVKGYASTFDRIPDSYGDVVAKGAFADSLKHWESIGKPIPLLYGHSTDDPKYNIGKVTKAYEDDHGLYVEAEFDAENDTAQYVRKLAKEGRLYQFSFAYEVLDWGETELPDGTKANELRKLNLFEVSLVQIPANQRAEVTEVKDAKAEAKSGRRNSKADEDELRRIRSIAEDIIAAVDGLINIEDSEERSEEAGSDLSAQAQSDDGQAKASDAELLEFYKATVKTTFKE